MKGNPNGAYFAVTGISGDDSAEETCEVVGVFDSIVEAEEAISSLRRVPGGYAGVADVWFRPDATVDFEWLAFERWG